MKPKILIVGRTSCGKDTVARYLTSKYGLKQLLSTTTRPKRTPDEDTHVFVTAEEAATMTDRVAATVINGYEYFATRQQYDDCDIYVIDPKGIDYLVKMSDAPMAIVYVTMPLEKSLERAISRGNPEVEAAVFKKRYASEDEQFSEFEKVLKDDELFKKRFPPCKYHVIIENKGTVEELYKMVDNVYACIN